MISEKNKFLLLKKLDGIRDCNHETEAGVAGPLETIPTSEVIMVNSISESASALILLCRLQARDS